MAYKEMEIMTHDIVVNGDRIFETTEYITGIAKTHQMNHKLVVAQGQKTLLVQDLRDMADHNNTHNNK